mgnify:CR=1 FL=1|tara:strand:+ start:2192 stop:3319 length:1128 start_codon:yes stop_codon:yes gene_type:complete
MGKAGSTSSVQIPQYIEDAARRNLDRAYDVSQMGSVPMSYGPTVAAFTPMQNAAFMNTADMASQYGLGSPGGGEITGMPPPTDFGGGIMGYSAKPLYDYTMDEFRTDRPGQAAFIDNFFIDPYTGQPSIRPNVGMNGQPMMGSGSGGGSNSGGVGQQRADFMADHMERQKKNYAEGVSDGAIGFAKTPDGGVYALGYEPGQMSPEVAAMTPGYSMVDKNPFDMTFGEHVGQIRSDVSDMKDRVASDVSKVASGGTVMCTAYYQMGWLPKEIWNLDRRYGVKVYREDPSLIEGYHLWGIPIANYIQKNTFFAKTFRSLMWPIVKAWAEEMAHCMKPKQYKPNYFGKAIKFVGEPFSRLCGSIYKYNVRNKRTVKEV